MRWLILLSNDNSLLILTLPSFNFTFKIARLRPSLQVHQRISQDLQNWLQNSNIWRLQVSKMHLRSTRATSKGHSEGSFSSLPAEMYEKILEKLDPLDLLRVSRVSQKFWHLSQSPLIWRRKCKESGTEGE